MSNSLNSLSEENHEQLTKYLRFFRSKKESLVRSMRREFADVKSDRLHEDMYTASDMAEYTDYVESALNTLISTELGSIINMSAIAIDQLLESAQDRGVDLKLETSNLENQALLEAVEKMSLDSLPKNAKRGVNTLVSFKNEAKAMKSESERLEEVNTRLQSEITQLKQKLSVSERNNLSLNESKNNDDSLGRSELRRLENALEESKEENCKRVAETVQFQQMRKLMQTQSSKIRELRVRLQKYEPECVKEDDDL